MTLTVGSLFSGIGGLDLGLERAGMEVIWQSEIDPYACKVLTKHWPEVVNHGDIKKINWQEVERPDVICGGYPCQPFSTAGKRRGEEDPRHLWPWVKQAISELRPRYAILENVRGHLSMGGLSVIGELATIGYDAEWRIVSAASVGANHRRDRIIIVAYPNDSRPHRAQINTTETGLDALGGLRGRSTDVADPDNAGNRASRCDIDGDGQTVKQGREIVSQFGACGFSTDVADTDCEQLDGRGHGNSETTARKRETLQVKVDRSSSDGHMANTNSERLEGQRPEQQTTRPAGDSQEKPISNDECERHGEHRITTDAGQEDSRGVYHSRGEAWYDGWQWWETEPDVGRVANGVPSRVDRLRGLGNAVVPQVAEVIGRLVISHAQHN